jgi:putative ABC transport system permease protein
MLALKIAFRNILRNRRRSAMTGSAVAVGALALLAFGAFTTYIFAGLETGLVQQIGHIAVFRSGYFLFGPGNPTAYAIDDYQGVMKLIGDDPQLRPLVNVMTPTQFLVGIAGNFEEGNDAAKTFLGIGQIPSDREKMRRWDEFGAGRPNARPAPMSDDDPSRGMIGLGLARILGLCGRLRVDGCPAPPQAATPPGGAAARDDLAELAQRETAGTAPGPGAAPRLDLLAASVAGAPNVVSLNVAGVDPQGVKELDDNYVGMHLSLAQQLVYGRGEHKATGIIVQLHRSEDLPAARRRLAALIAAHKLDLELRDFAERTPFYGQVVKLFGAIFFFMAVIMGVIVLFAVVNTMTMNVMERVSEIGTTRAMGVRRSAVRRQFVLEGAMLGAIGAALGLLLATAVVAAVNHAGIMWVPPGNALAIPLRLDLYGRPQMLVDTWAGLVLVATIAALIPANRAARLTVVDALRHV